MGEMGPTGLAGVTGPTGAAAATIPFSISKYGVSLSTDAQGLPLTVAFAGFAPSHAASEYLQQDEWTTGTITIREDMNFGPSFVMPHDATLRNIEVLFSIASELPLEPDTIVRPFVCLAISNAESLVYTILRDTMTYTEPYVGGAEYPRHTLRRGSLENLSVEIPKGTLVGIVAGIMVDNAQEETYSTFAVSGGLYLE